MSEGQQPKYKGDGVAVWVNQTKEGKTYLSVKILNGLVVNCYKNEPKPVQQKPKITEEFVL